MNCMYIYIANYISEEIVKFKSSYYTYINLLYNYTISHFNFITYSITGPDYWYVVMYSVAYLPLYTLQKYLCTMGQCPTTRDQPIIHLSLIIMLCCSVLKFTYYAQYHAQEQELWSNYYAIYIQVCMNNLLHVANSFRKTVLLEYIYEWNQCITLRWPFY